MQQHAAPSADLPPVKALLRQHGPVAEIDGLPVGNQEAVAPVLNGSAAAPVIPPEQEVTVLINDIIDHRLTVGSGTDHAQHIAGPRRHMAQKLPHALLAALSRFSGGIDTHVAVNLSGAQI